MSSTNRGKDRSKFDYYRTPIDEIRKFLHQFRFDYPLTFPLNILDPCAGGDATHPASYPEALRDSFGSEEPYHVTTVDIREDSRADFKFGYLGDILFDRAFDLVISNPPFDLAQEFILKALTDVEHDGLVIMLHRLNFFGGQARKEFWKLHMPEATYVHSKRMSFTDDGKTDSIEYCHSVWRKGNHPAFTKMRII